MGSELRGVFCSFCVFSIDTIFVSWYIVESLSNFHYFEMEKLIFRDGKLDISTQIIYYFERKIMGKDVIVACDFKSAAEVYAFLDRFTGRKPFVKIGMELFYAEGPQIVREIKRRGHKVFLDLKLCDIPNTVKKAMSVLSSLDVDICNVHAFGSTEMMRAALEGLTRGDGTRPLLIAVTILTSTDQATLNNDMLIDRPMDEVVMSYALTAKNAGLDGVVCSSMEAGRVHAACGEHFLTVTPGIRFPEDEVGDQKRVMSPADAKEVGADYIVVGRPITGAADPVAAYERCVREFCE